MSPIEYFALGYLAGALNCWMLTFALWYVFEMQHQKRNHCRNQ